MSTHREIFDRNLVDLCDLTHCNDILIDRCTERDVITRAEKDEIEIEKIMFKRNRVFYTIMRRKDVVMFNKLVEIMKENSTAQSSDVLDMLEENQSGPSNQKCPEFQNRLKRKEPSVWFNVQDPITTFVGRENELKELHKIVTRNADKDTQVAIMSQLSSVSGMGGIGKTTLAREYAKRYASFFNNNIIWINAETTTSTEESFRELADEIGIRTMILEQQNQKVTPISKVTKDTYEYFSTRKSLFVFDNVEEYKITVDKFIPKSYQPGKIRPYILMTSRKQRLVDDCKVLSLDVLAFEDAEKFISTKLQKCMGQIDSESVRKLAKELQCLPLALQQAVSYIRNQVQLKSFFSRNERNHIEEYLKLLDENPKVPLNHEYQDDTMDDYAYTVMRTWDITLRAIEREEYGSKAIEILEMMSYYPPDNVEIYIKYFCFLFSEDELERSFVILEQYSLINWVQEHINIHRLVQQVIRIQNKENDREEYLLGRCLLLAVKHEELRDFGIPDMNWNIWKHAVRYEDLVIKYRSFLLGKTFMFRDLKDLEILNSSLEIFEKNLPVYELVDLYYKFINCALGVVKIWSGYVPDLLQQQILTRLNVLLELRHADSIHKIVSIISLYFQLYAVNLIPKLSILVRDVTQVIRNHCYKQLAETFTIHDMSSYGSVESWSSEFFLLGIKRRSVGKFDFRELRHLFFRNFYLINQYLLHLESVTGDGERELVREILYFCRSPRVRIPRMEEVDILLCNILCLLLLNYNCVHEIQLCVQEVFVRMRTELAEFREVEPKIRLWWLVQLQFGSTVKTIILALNRIVIIGTTPLVSSEWAHYVEKVVKFIETFEKILEIELYTENEDSPSSCLPELDPIIAKIEDCWRVNSKQARNNE